MSEIWRTDDYFVSPSDYAPGAVKDFHFPKKVELHDVTLRDGEQQPGVVFTRDDKIRIASMLADVGVHRIEAGMPAVSESDREAIGQIVRMKLPSKIFVFSRARTDDVELAAQLGVFGVVIEIPSNDELVEYGYRWPLSKPVAAACEACALAHRLGLYVDLFLMDSSRLSAEAFVEKVRYIKQHSWVDSCSIVDTQGTLSVPGAKYMVREAVRALDVPVEAHFHNDLGLGTATALAAFESGASVLHTTLLGLGPRAGQGATEQVAIALKLAYGYDSGIKLDRLYDLGIETGRIAGVQIPGNQPVLGDKIYQIEAGMPATWWPNVEKEHPLSLYGILPSVMGQPPVSIVLGKGSGTSSIRYWLEKLNLTIRNEDDVPAILTRVKERSLEVKRGLTTEEFVGIVKEYQ